MVQLSTLWHTQTQAGSHTQKTPVYLLATVYIYIYIQIHVDASVEKKFVRRQHFENKHLVFRSCSRTPKKVKEGSTEPHHYARENSAREPLYTSFSITPCLPTPRLYRALTKSGSNRALARRGRTPKSVQVQEESCGLVWLTAVRLV